MQPANDTPGLKQLSSPALAAWLAACVGQQSVLIAVSGGLDSMTLWKLLHATGHPYTVAHVNYHLRAAASDADAELVTRLARQRNSRCDVLDNHTLIGASNVQDRARKIRYDYFEQVMLAQGHAAVLLAHHADDQLETVLIGLLRGAGPRALAGMRTVNGKRLRPLLAIPKTHLSAFAKTHNVEYREDASNSTDNYLRNRVRHHILPSLLELGENTLGPSLRTLNQQADLLNFGASQARLALAACCELVNANTSQLNGQHVLLRSKLTSVVGLRYVLHVWLDPHGFAPQQIELVYQRLQAGTTARARFENKARNRVVVMAGDRVWLAHADAENVPLKLLD